MITSAPTRFKTNPSLTILLIENSPAPYTTAFGIVATGSINAQLALIAAGIRKSTASIPLAIEIAPSIGIKITVVAVLLVISVKNVTSSDIHKTINTVLKFSIPERSFAAYSLNPDSDIVEPRQIPEPTKIINPQGIWFAVSQSKSFSFFLLPGM